MMHLVRTLPFVWIIVLSACIAGCTSSDGSDDTTAESSAGSASNTAIDLIQGYERAIEECAARTTDGSEYPGCLDPARLRSLDPELDDPGSRVSVVPGADPKSFIVTATTGEQSFVATHDGAGNVERTCTPEDSPGCDDGSW